MKEAETGIYCGPLRLLAMEVFDSVNQEVCLSSMGTMLATLLSELDGGCFRINISALVKWQSNVYRGLRLPTQPY